jgi:hypothetical protein
LFTGLKPGASERPVKYSDLTRGTTAIDSTRERLGVRQTSAALGLLGVNESVPPRAPRGTHSPKPRGLSNGLIDSGNRQWGRNVPAGSAVFVWARFTARSMLDSLCVQNTVEPQKEIGCKPAV